MTHTSLSVGNQSSHKPLAKWGSASVERVQIRPVTVEPVRTIYGDHCRKRDAIEAVKDRYWLLKNKLAARMEREIKRLERM